MLQVGRGKGKKCKEPGLSSEHPDTYFSARGLILGGQADMAESDLKAETEDWSRASC